MNFDHPGMFTRALRTCVNTGWMDASGGKKAAKYDELERRLFVGWSIRYGYQRALLAAYKTAYWSRAEGFSSVSEDAKSE